MPRLFKDFIAEEADGKPRITLRRRDGTPALEDVSVEVASRARQEGDAWGALAANLLLRLDDNGVPIPRTDNPHSVTAAQTGAAQAVHAHDERYYTQAQANGQLAGKANTAGSYPGLAVGSAAQAANANQASRAQSAQEADYAIDALRGAKGSFGVGKGGLWANTSEQLILLLAESDYNYALKLGVENGAWTLCPNADGYLQLGRDNKRWGQIFSTNSVISTSDRAQKTEIAPLSPEVAQAFVLGLAPSAYKFKDGTSGRTHWGVIAQDVETLLQQLGMESTDFAGLCKAQKTREVQVITERLNEATGEAEPQLETRSLPVPGEYVYGLRYEELLAPLIATVQAQHRALADLQARVKALESGAKA